MAAATTSAPAAAWYVRNVSLDNYKSGTAPARMPSAPRSSRAQRARFVALEITVNPEWFGANCHRIALWRCGLFLTLPHVQFCLSAFSWRFLLKEGSTAIVAPMLAFTVPFRRVPARFAQWFTARGWSRARTSLPCSNTRAAANRSCSSRRPEAARRSPDSSRALSKLTGQPPRRRQSAHALYFAAQSLAVEVSRNLETPVARCTRYPHRDADRRYAAIARLRQLTSRPIFFSPRRNSLRFCLPRATRIVFRPICER